jgi:hypothetical protein
MSKTTPDALPARLHGTARPRRQASSKYQPALVALRLAALRQAETPGPTKPEGLTDPGLARGRDGRSRQSA